MYLNFIYSGHRRKITNGKPSKICLECKFGLHSFYVNIWLWGHFPNRDRAVDITKDTVSILLNPLQGSEARLCQTALLLQYVVAHTWQ